MIISTYMYYMVLSFLPPQDHEMEIRGGGGGKMIYTHTHTRTLHATLLTRITRQQQIILLRPLRGDIYTYSKGQLSI